MHTINYTIIIFHPKLCSLLFNLKTSCIARVCPTPFHSLFPYLGRYCYSCLLSISLP
uniref:Uncharacterized protein n=1 Tax=Rhizophora mucronata TaxID=61149 RepID=A0A2P2KYF6_RHIMU